MDRKTSLFFLLAFIAVINAANQRDITAKTGAKGGAGDDKDTTATNADLVRTLEENTLRQQYLGIDSPTVVNIPEFTSKRDETKWKLNYAKETLRKAREVQELAKKAAKHFGYYRGDLQGHTLVKDIIGKAEDELFKASEKMGYDYEKY